MEAERWEKIADLYHAASECAPEERNKLLTQSCEGDESLRGEVESLLAENISSDGVLERTARLGLTPWGSEQPLPASIGRYRILSLIGEGGMGMVFQAEQDNPRRIVALKVLRQGLPASQLVRRFEREAKALARLQHPGIAQIYEAGAAKAGYGLQPYFAMEFIRGLSLVQYADANELPTRRRLEVMAKVCEAAHHAHQRGIIHCDLKPGNILVDETGQPKILDFGVSQLTDAEAHATRQTRAGEVVGTLAYMSPEQVLADGRDIDARSDVYALGVVLYELLAGRLPYDVGTQIHEAARAIQEDKPAPLAAADGSYRGDIETIVNKALQKDKAQRYESAAEFAADLERYLADRPILARPSSAGYQLRKFARRHTALVAAVAAVFLVLVAGVAASTWEAIRATRAERAALAERDRAAAAEQSAGAERDRARSAEQTARAERIRAEQERNRAVEEKRRADTQAAMAKAVSDFLQDDLLAQASARAQSRPNVKPDPDLKVRTALDRAAAGIPGKFDSQPLVEAAIRQTIGVAYRDLGLQAESARQLERALELRQRELGPQDPETLTSMFELAKLDTQMGKYAEAEGLLTTVFEERRRILGEQHRDTLAAMNDLAITVSTHDSGRAEVLFERLLPIERRLLGEEHSDVLAVMNNLATLYVNRGKYSQAEGLYEKAVEAKRRILGEEHPSTLLSMNSLGVAYRNQGKYAQAEAILEKTLEARQRVQGERHNDTLTSLNSLAMVYKAEGRYAQAEPLLDRVVEVRRGVLGKEHPETLSTMANLAELYRQEGRHPEAASLYETILDARRRVLGPAHPSIANILASLGAVRLDQQYYAEAEPLLREALSVYQKNSPDTWRRFYTEGIFGAALVRRDKLVEAEPLLLSGYRGLSERTSAIPFENRAAVDEVRQWIVELYARWDKPQDAIAWRNRRAKP
jgi:tetratricopeptide (TPR) repeat protein